MAKKKERAFFVCPRWNEVAGAGTGPPSHVHQKTVAAIVAGRPIARSTLRKALMAARTASGSMGDIDGYIVDQRTTPPLR